MKSSTGTNMNQEDYERLKDAAGAPMTDAEAKMLINDEFRFEATGIRILHEAELDVTEPGSKYITLEKVPREPMNASTDWNYIRFNIHGCAAEWYFEMINGELMPVNI